MMSLAQASPGMTYSTNDSELKMKFDEMFESLGELKFDECFTSSCTCTFNCTAFCPTEGECI